MTDNSTPLPEREEPAKAEQPDIDEMPTAMLAPDDATLTMPTSTSADTFATASMTPPEIGASTQTMQTDVLASPAPATPVTQQAAPMYTPSNAPTEAVASSSDEITGPYKQLPSGDPTVYAAAPYAAQPGQPQPAQGVYAQYAAIPPSQPGQPYAGQPGVPVAKRRRPLLWAAIIVIVLLVIGGGTAFAIVSNLPTNSPTQALQQFCHGMTTLNAQEVYGTFSAASRQKESLVQVKESFALIEDFNGTVKFSKCTVASVQENGSTATGQVDLTTVVDLLGLSSSSTTHMPMQLVLENKTWKIDFTKGSNNITIPSDIPTQSVSGN